MQSGGQSMPGDVDEETAQQLAIIAPVEEVQVTADVAVRVAQTGVCKIV